MHLEHDAFCADARQQLLFEVLGHHVFGRGFEHQRGDARRGQPVAQPGVAEIGDGGNINRHLRQHDKHDDERQHAGREAETHRPVSRRNCGLCGHARQPQKRRKRSNRARPGRVSCGAYQDMAARREISDRVG